MESRAVCTNGTRAVSGLWARLGTPSFDGKRGKASHLERHALALQKAAASEARAHARTHKTVSRSGKAVENSE